MTGPLKYHQIVHTGMDNPIPCQPGLKPSADASLLNASWPLHLREDRALWTLAARFLHDLVLLTFCLKDSTPADADTGEASRPRRV